MTRTLLPLAAIILSIATAACRNDEGPDTAVPQVTNIVTYEGTDGMATFTFREVDDSPLITLRASVTMPDGIPAGQRCLLRYTPAGGDPSASGDITVSSIGAVTTLQPKTGSLADMPAWDSSPVWVESFWRSGTFINLRAKLPWSSEGRLWGLYIDEQSLADDSAEAVAYLMHEAPAGSTFMRTFYTSFTLADLIDEHPHLRGITINVNNSNLTDKTSFSFAFPPRPAL